MRGVDPDSRYYKEFRRYTERLIKRIQALRKQQGLTQEQMQVFELTLRHYQRIESGETVNITLFNLFKLAKAFEMKPHELLDI